MYRKLLLTTDGSTLSAFTAYAGVRLAQQLGAEVLVLYVAPDYHYPVYVELMPPTAPSADDYRARMEHIGAGFVQPVLDEAARCGVAASSRIELADAVATQIVSVASEAACDLIFIGSHGRSGWGQLLLGSVTSKVLSHTAIPVLVHRLLKQPPA